MSTVPSVTPGQYRTTGTIRQRYRQLYEDPVQESPAPMDPTTVPQRPVRTKSLSRKQSGDFTDTEMKLSPRPAETILTNANSQNGASGLGIVSRDRTPHESLGVPVYRQEEEAKPDTSVNPAQKKPGHAPKQRSQRRLTRGIMNFKKLEDDEYIGFASLPEQVHRKAIRKGFDFTLMVVGETGLGKSTLINSLFLMDLYKDRKVDNIEERIHKTVEMEKKELEIEERGVKLKLTIVDTPGFNDSINERIAVWHVLFVVKLAAVLDYVDSQFDAYYKAESGLNRKNIQDTRVHCCLYFISPYGHGLKQTDIVIMRKLHHKVNIIPLIAKSDMLTRQECRRLKDRILEEIQRHRIDVYQFPDCDSDEDEEFKKQDQELKSCLPFAVVGSNTVVEAGGKKVRGRMYPWGIVEVENPLHSDFTKLRRMLISTHMQDLKDMTCEVHYENYRADRLSGTQVSSHTDSRKLKRDSTATLESDLVTDRLLREKEEEIRRMSEVVAKMQAQLQSQNSPRVNGRVAQV